MKKSIKLAVGAVLVLALGFVLGASYGHCLLRKWELALARAPAGPALAHQQSGPLSPDSTPQHPVYVLSESNVAMPKDETGVRRRLQAFMKSAEVTGYGCYKTRNFEGGPTDVYLVFNKETLLGEVHLVRWLGTGGAYDHRVVVHYGGAGIGGPLLFLDIDNRRDGQRQVIFLSYFYPVIVDFRKPRGKEIVQDGDFQIPQSLLTNHPFEWKFADLDGDGRYEAIGLFPIEHSSAQTGLPEPTGETAYLVYHWQKGRYVFQKVLRTDPTTQLK